MRRSPWSLILPRGLSGDRMTRRIPGRPKARFRGWGQQPVIIAVKGEAGAGSLALVGFQPGFVVKVKEGFAALSRLNRQTIDGG